MKKETKEEHFKKVEENKLVRYANLVKAEKYNEAKVFFIKKCKEDILYFFQYFLYTEKNGVFFEGNETGINVPFVLFDYQKDFVLQVHNAIHNKQNIFIEKSRQMGITWMLVGIFVYEWLFHDKKLLILSKTATEVDTKGDMKSCFEKIRYMIRLLPSWMLPKGFSKESGTDHNKYMVISKPGGTASITGEPASADAGRGGTYDAVFADEMAFMQDAMSINKSISRATRCRIINSTPNGEGNEYFRMRIMALKELDRYKKLEITKDKIRMIYIRLHWTLHPFYTKEWYEEECRTSSKETIAQELDIDYNTAIVGRVYKDFSEPTIYIGDDIEYDYRLPLYCSIDNGENDPNAIVLYQTSPRDDKIRIIDAVEIYSSIDNCASILAKIPNSGYDMPDEVFEFFQRFKYYKTPVFISDPYDTKANRLGNSIDKIYRKKGIHLEVPTILRGVNGNVDEQVRITRNNLNKLMINSRLKETFIRCIQNAKYPKQGESSTKKVVTPIHDWTSHYRTSLEYFMLYITEHQDREVQKMTRQPKTQTRQIGNPLTGKIEYINC